MKIVQLQAENFKRLVAVEITPEGNIVEVTGKNGSGKSSVLDAIYVALVGRSAAPPKPIRTGEEQALIRLDLGDLTVTRKFSTKEGGTYTDSLKVENAEGLRYGKPQEVLDALLGEIGFDPFEFVQMRAGDQADTLLRMVPLPVDLDELAEQDQSDYQNRRDINRDHAALKAQLEAIPKEEVPDEVPDRQALTEKLSSAAETNSKIERERMIREQERGDIERIRAAAEDGELRAAVLRKEAEELEEMAKERRKAADEQAKQLDAREPLPDPVDTEALRTQLEEADRIAGSVARQKRRGELAEQVTKLAEQSQALTDAMAAREKERQEALAKAEMPIEGLGFAIDEKGKPMVTFGGVPFEQASTAEQLRASTAIAMAANPSLRVLRVKDGSLLDEDSMKLLAEMAKAEDFQLWIERVGTDGGVGIVMENGEIKAAPAKKGKAKADDKPEGALV